MKQLKNIFSFLMLLLSLSCYAQDLAYMGNPDASFFTARDLAFAGNRLGARDTLNRILTKYPEYTDVRNLLAKTLSWDGNYVEARKQFNKITSTERKNKEVWVAAIKNELYAQEYSIALGLANKALTFIKGDKELLELKKDATEKINSKNSSHEEVRKQFNRITSVERKNKDAWIAAVKNEIYAQEYYLALGIANKALTYLKGDKELQVIRDYAKLHIHTTNTNTDSKDSETKSQEEKALVNSEKKDLEELPKNNRIMISNSFDVFDKVYDPMIYTSISYKRETGAGSVIPRINYSNRFQTHGIQYEIDFYPKFSKTFYAYLNYGYSKAPIFPDHRVGGELYANLPKGIEASAGFRFLDFSFTKALIYTGSFGMYKGNYYFSLRPYVTPNSNGDLGVSGNLLVRKYLKDADNYLGLRAGMGFSPELKQLLNGDELLAETVLYVESQQVQLEYQFTGWVNSNSYKANLGVTRQELVFDSGNFFWSVSAGITAQVKF